MSALLTVMGIFCVFLSGVLTQAAATDYRIGDRIDNLHLYAAFWAIAQLGLGVWLLT